MDPANSMDRCPSFLSNCSAANTQDVSERWTSSDQNFHSTVQSRNWCTRLFTKKRPNVLRLIVTLVTANVSKGNRGFSFLSVHLTALLWNEVSQGDLFSGCRISHSYRVDSDHVLKRQQIYVLTSQPRGEWEPSKETLLICSTLFGFPFELLNTFCLKRDSN